MNLLNRIKNLFVSQNGTTRKNKIGRIKFFNRQKGYGFIESDNTTKDVFVHATNLEDYVRKGDKVAFELDYSQKGLEAKNVKVLNRS